MYKLTNKLFDYSPEYIIRISDNAFFPKSEDNTDYQDFLAWKAEGNEPLPADEPTQGAA